MRTISLLLLLSVSALLHAQVEVGYIHDLDRFPIHGFVNPREYNPKMQLNFSHNSDSYEKGKIYYDDGIVAEGLIKFENKKIWFKRTADGLKEKLKPEEILGLTIGIDSFFVASNFNVEFPNSTSTRTLPQFMQFLGSFGGRSYAKHYNFSQSGIITETYQVKVDSSDKWVSFPKKEDLFKSVALTYFSHVPLLKTKITEGDKGSDDIFSIIKMAEYFEKYQEREPVYYDEYWNELKSKHNSVFKAEILSIEEDIWTIHYSKNDTSFYEAQYYALFPHEKGGYVNYFNEKGDIIQTEQYDTDKKKAATILFENGNTHYAYNLVKRFTDYEEYYEEPDYHTVNDSLGNSILSSSQWIENSGKESNTVNEFTGNVLSASYREENGRRIYQIIDPDYKFKIKRLRSKLYNHMQARDFSEASEANAEGTYFIKIVISEKGRVEDFKILNAVHPEVDFEVNIWANLNLPVHAEYAIRFKPYKIGKEKVYAEFLVPVKFSINKFYRRPSGGYYHNWHFDQMMHQQMMMNSFSPPTPPSF